MADAAPRVMFVTGGSRGIGAGIVLGAKVPIVLTSRADTARTRTASTAVAVVIAHARRAQRVA